MFELTGKYNTAKVFSNGYDDKATGQIINLLNQDFVTGSQIAIMPDYHYGAGCTIGFVAKNMTKIVPNLLGVDLGCGMIYANLGTFEIDYSELDNVIHSEIPLGRNIYELPVRSFKKIDELFCYDELKNQSVFYKAVGSLGGGNHFIEIDESESGEKYLVIHTGSRNMGKQVAEYYQSLAVEHCKGKDNFESFRASEVERLKSIGEQKKISKMLQELDKQYKNQKPEYPEDLCFLEGQQMEDYFHDMKICQEYASLNRMVIADRILDAMYKNNIWDYEWNETIHNYYNFEDETMRKGAISAHKDEYGIIPINMRDGSIIFRGKGFSGSLNSAPHGAGRLFGRNEAKRQFNLTDFQDTMFDVYSTSVCEGTLDESPMAYKTMDDILENISEMVDVVDIVKSKYNCKAGGE